MSSERIAASVRQRLITLHRHVNVSHELLMRRYAFERLLDRLSRSEFRRELCLKGAMAFFAISGDVNRPTRDMDFAGREPMTKDDLLAIWKAVAAIVPDKDDGLEFLVDGFEAQPIQADDEEPGVQIKGICMLGSARVPLKLEVSFGSALTPGAVVMDYPTLLAEFAPPRVLCYSAETILAEKFEAICSLGTFNSRFKDFYDIREISRRVDFDGAIAAEAFRNTFSRRGTALPSENPASFQPDFEAIGERGWRAFQRRQGFVDAQSFAELVAEITPLVMGVVSLAKGQEGLPYWKPGNGWVNAPRPDDARTFESF